MRDAVTAVRDVFVAISRSQCWQPQRLVSPDGKTLIMAASRDGTATLIKTVSVNPENRGKGLPTIASTAFWLEGVTGQANAVIDGATLTALRTGAATGAATDVFASPNAAMLAMIGAGTQAKDQVHGVCAVRDIETIRILSRSGTSADRLAAELSHDYPDIDISSSRSTNTTIEGADIICCATTATEPLFSAGQLGSRVHLNAIGAFRPDMRELGTDTFGQATVVVVEQLDAALDEAGDLMDAVVTEVLDRNAIVELGEIIARPAFEASGITVYKSVGVAMEDLAVAELALSRLPTESGIAVLG